jgi:hypothetical protein
MRERDGYLPTVPAQQPVSLPPPLPGPAPSRRAYVIAGLAGTFLLGMLIGIAIGHATADAPPPAAAASGSAASELGHLAVSSLPADGNITVDGRFVGVAPVARVDLEPGKHSVVIDAFGYQPYAGTLEMEPRSKVTLKVTLVPIGGTGTTSGNVTGGKATTATVPATALQPPAPATAGAGSATKPAKDPPRSRRADSRGGYSPPPAYEPPPRPRRDCSGEKSRCRDGCSRAESDCRFSCSTCTSCLSSMGSDECRRQCDACRGSCERNTKFCEAGCDSQYDNCQASQ